MKTMIYLITICFMALMALPAIMPVESKGNSAFAEWRFGHCPECWVYQCGENLEDRCFSACLPYAEDAYYFHFGYWKHDGYTHHWSCLMMESWSPTPHYIHMLLVNSQLYLCEKDENEVQCYEYTAKMTKSSVLEQNDHWADDSPYLNYEWQDIYAGSALWAISDGLDNFDPTDPNTWICGGFDDSELHDVVPPWRE